MSLISAVLLSALLLCAVFVLNVELGWAFALVLSIFRLSFAAGATLVSCTGLRSFACGFGLNKPLKIFFCSGLLFVNGVPDLPSLKPGTFSVCLSCCSLGALLSLDATSELSIPVVLSSKNTLCFGFSSFSSTYVVSSFSPNLFGKSDINALRFFFACSISFGLLERKNS